MRRVPMALTPQMGRIHECIRRKNMPARKAVIYCRVSSAKQMSRGDGLASQETRCREYARYKGYEVADVYKDDMSGSVTARPGMLAMLAFLRKHRRSGYVVIIDDNSRLARGLDAHLKLRAAISGAGGSLESPSIEFGEDSGSILDENLLASVSQHQRQKNGEQTINRMRARTLNGYWFSRLQSVFGISAVVVMETSWSATNRSPRSWRKRSKAMRLDASRHRLRSSGFSKASRRSRRTCRTETFAISAYTRCCPVSCIPALSRCRTGMCPS